MAEGFQYRNIKIDLLEDHDATQSINVDKQICGDYTWNVMVCYSGLTDGPPIAQIYVSNDGVKWIKYNECVVNEDGSDVAFYDQIMAFEFIRLSIDANGTTGGTINANLLLKNS